MQTLTAGSFLNLENAEAVEALKFTARRLAEHSSNVVAENLQPASLENLANSLWDKAEYVARETQRRRLHQIFVENFSERFRELKPSIFPAENSTLEVSPNGSTIAAADSVNQTPAPEIIARGMSEYAAVEGTSSTASQKYSTEVEVKRDEFLGFVKAGEPFGDSSVAEMDAMMMSATVPEKTEQAIVQAANETASETSKSENRSVATETPSSEKSRIAAEAEVSAENPNAAKSQSAAAVNDSPAASADKTAAQTAKKADAEEPFEFGKCTVNLSLVLLPSSGGGRERKVIVSATSHKLPPEIDFLEIAEGEDLTQIADLVRDKLARLKQTLPVKYIEQLRASKTKLAKKLASAKATAAPTQPASSKSNVEKESGEQKTQEASGVETEKPQQKRRKTNRPLQSRSCRRFANRRMKFKAVCSKKQKIMSENLISENENAASETLTAETVATEQTTNAADAAKIEESAAAATTNALVKIEGQEFPLDVSIAADDNLLKAALSPHYPSIKNAGITRETRAGQMIVSIVKKAEHKGIYGEGRQAS